ncbi:MAG: hypothetical protein KJ051_08565 [Thermoleophilia bacterium]|nr:hypothetical protein [Thermoleophilia bacterium]
MSRQTQATLAALVGMLVGLGVLAGVVLWLTGDDGGASAPVAPATSEAVETDTGELVPTDLPPAEEIEVITVGGFPNAVAVGAGGVWVVRDGRRLIRVDPVTGAIVAKIGAGDELGSERPCGVAVAKDAVWVTTVSGNLVRINPKTNRFSRTIDLDEAACVAFGAGAVWVTAPNAGTVTRIDPATGAVVAVIEVGGYPQGIAVGFRGVWVASGNPPSGVNGAVTRIDPRTNEAVSVIPVPDVPEYVVAGAGAVWVTAETGTIRRIEPGTNALLDPPIAIAETGRTLVAVGGDSVWALVMSGPDSLGAAVEVDPRTEEVVGESVELDKAPLGMAFGAGALWVANYESGTVTRHVP